MCSYTSECKAYYNLFNKLCLMESRLERKITEGENLIKELETRIDDLELLILSKHQALDELDRHVVDFSLTRVLKRSGSTLESLKKGLLTKFGKR